MASVQERLQLKRVPLENWSISEQLYLASAVAGSGDQNWMSVSRQLKTMCGNNRPSDWFSAKICAAQYEALLGNVEQTKRKKRNEKDTTIVETPIELIVRKLTQERLTELNKLIQEERDQLLMWQTFQSAPNEKSYCPIFKWTEGTFMEIDHIPCTNAMQVEPFLIDQQIYVAVANYMDENQNIETYSTIFHYDIDTHRFNLTRQFKTYGAIDVKHIFIEEQHF